MRRDLIGTLLLYSPVILALILVLPRLADPRFGLMDDGASLRAAKAILERWGTLWDVLKGDARGGRLRPLYFLYFVPLYATFGSQPLPYFLAGAFWFMAITVMIVYLSYKATGEQSQAWLAGVLFVLAGPSIENFYTLKIEPVQLFFILASIVVFVKLRPFSGWLKQLTAVSVMSLMLFLAYAAKEPTIAMVPIAFAWTLLASRDKRSPDATGDALVFLIAVLVSTLGFFVMRSIFGASISGGSYTQMYVLELSKMGSSISSWALLLMHDFVYVVPIFLAWAAVRALSGFNHDHSRLLLYASAWLIFWFAFYLPWIFVVDYYLLPFSVGVAFVASLMVVDAVKAMKGGGKARKILVSSCVVVALLLLALTVPANIKNAQIQLAVDSVNSKMMDYIAKNAPPQSVVLINGKSIEPGTMETFRDYMSLVEARQDIKIFMLPNSTQANSSQHANYIISQSIAKFPLLSVRVELLEEKSWPELEECVHYGNISCEGWRLASNYTSSLLTPTVDVSGLLCPYIHPKEVCSERMPFFDSSTFSYAANVYGEV